jgi:nucleoside 2-deoxyribosyltransferase
MTLLYRDAPLIYIASPYSHGDAFVNVQRQQDAANKILNLGALPIWPLCSAYLNMSCPREWEEWMDICLGLANRCDALWRLDGDSRGADLEVEFMLAQGKPVFYYEDDLQAWLASL